MTRRPEHEVFKAASSIHTKDRLCTLFGAKSLLGAFSLEKIRNRVSASRSERPLQDMFARYCDRAAVAEIPYNDKTHGRL